MLLNKTPVLDKGYVALISTHNDGETLYNISYDLLKADLNSNLYNIASMTLMIKCPLFVQLNISKFGLSIVDVPVDVIEAYTPDLTDVGGPDHVIAKEIAEDIHKTQEALLINPLAYQKDGCNRFISQVISPISVYNEIIVSGNLSNWLKFARQKNLPKPVQAYCNSVKDIISNEWKRLEV